MATRLYRNQGSDTVDLSVYGLGELQPGEQVSVTGEHLPPIVIENHPGLVDATNEEVNEEVPEEDGRVS